MLNFMFDKSDGLGLLTFDGELTAEYAEHVVVNLDKVTRIDLICIQLLRLAYEKSKRLKKWLTLICTHPETYEQLKVAVA